MSEEKRLQRIDEILEQHGLKKTHLRRRLLLLFLQHKKSLTQGELIAALEGPGDGAPSIDRVSIYRNLTNLKDAGILHEVDRNNYVFCSHDCGHHAHVLLFCQRCHRHQEVKDHQRIEVFMAAIGELGLLGQQGPILVRGFCNACSRRLVCNIS